MAFVLCSNKFSLEPDPLTNITEEDSEWLKANISAADLQEGQKWFIEDKSPAERAGTEQDAEQG